VGIPDLDRVTVPDRVSDRLPERVRETVTERVAGKVVGMPDGDLVTLSVLETLTHIV